MNKIGNDLFYVKQIEVIKNPGAWEHYRVGIFSNENGIEKQIGEYDRSYSLMETFCPFKQNDKWYALYSKDYTATRVMSLPDCKDICGEESDSLGFCPAEYYVPCANGIYPDVPIGRYNPLNASLYNNWEISIGTKLAGTFGFIAGCHWGDDSSYKVQYLDLSRITEGIFIREGRFGYVELPEEYTSLKDCVNFINFDPEDEDPIITITTGLMFNKSGKPLNLEYIGKKNV